MGVCLLFGMILSFSENFISYNKQIQEEYKELKALDQDQKNPFSDLGESIKELGESIREEKHPIVILKQLVIIKTDLLRIHKDLHPYYPWEQLAVDQEDGILVNTILPEDKEAYFLANEPNDDEVHSFLLRAGVKPVNKRGSFIISPSLWLYDKKMLELFDPLFLEETKNYKRNFGSFKNVLLVYYLQSGLKLDAFNLSNDNQIDSLLDALFKYWLDKEQQKGLHLSGCTKEDLIACIEHVKKQILKNDEATMMIKSSSPQTENQFFIVRMFLDLKSLLTN